MILEQLNIMTAKDLRSVQCCQFPWDNNHLKLRNQPARVNDVYGLSIVYKEEDFANALVIIDPNRPETFRADEDIKILMSNEN